MRTWHVVYCRAEFCSVVLKQGSLTVMMFPLRSLSRPIQHSQSETAWTWKKENDRWLNQFTHMFHLIRWLIRPHIMIYTSVPSAFLDHLLKITFFSFFYISIYVNLLSFHSKLNFPDIIKRPAQPYQRYNVTVSTCTEPIIKITRDKMLFFSIRLTVISRQSKYHTSFILPEWLKWQLKGW